MLGPNEGSESTSLATQAAAPGASPHKDLTNVAKNNSQKNPLLLAPKSKKPLCKHTEDALKQYFASLNGDRPGDLYDLVMGEVERPLFKAVMDFTDGNQSQAAGILGINRGTLRKKLKTYSLIR